MKLLEVARPAVKYREFTGAEHDQYYMQPSVAKQISEWVKRQPFFKNVTRVLDPCAGSGEMTCHFPGAAAFDLDPRPNEYGIEIKRQDFFKHKQDYDPGLLLIMNVPYGYHSQTAVDFFNHGAKFAEYMALVVPRTWSREGYIDNRLTRDFTKIAEMPLPKNSFYLPSDNNKEYDVPSVAQIWVRGERKPYVSEKNSPLFKAMINRPNLPKPSIAIRRTGRRAGDVVQSGFDDLTTQGWWFIYTKDPNVVEAIKNIDWSQYGHVMAQRSISKEELVRAIHGYFSR